MGESEPIPAKPPARFIGILSGVWLLLGGLPVYAKMFGYDFLPSNDWTSKAQLAGLGAGLVSGVGLLWLTLWRFDRSPVGEGKKLAGLVFAPFFGYLLGNNIVIITIPMLVSLAAGHHVEIPFTVKKADIYGGHRCGSPLELEGLPFAFDKICRVRDQFRKTLAPGAQVIVLGYGTTMGLYVDDVHR